MAIMPFSRSDLAKLTPRAQRLTPRAMAARAVDQR